MLALVGDDLVVQPVSSDGPAHERGAAERQRRA
jgi:hypothetical protein